MPTKSNPAKIVRHHAGAAPPLPPVELESLRAAMDDPVDTTDSPELVGPVRRIKRDAKGRLPQPLPALCNSPSRLAILLQLERLRMSRYELWQAAKKHCPQITSSAVYEYLQGQRPIGVVYLDAIITAARLTLKPSARTSKPKPTAKKKARRRASSSAAIS